MFHSHLFKSYGSLNQELSKAIKGSGIAVWKSRCESSVLDTVQTFIMNNERLILAKSLKTYQIQLICVELIHEFTINYVLTMSHIKELIINHSAASSVAVKYTNQQIRDTYLNKIPCITFNIPRVPGNSLISKPDFQTYVSLSCSPSWIPNYMAHVIDFISQKLYVESIYRIQCISHVHDTSKHLLNYNKHLNNNMSIYSIKSILEAAGASGQTFLSELNVRTNSQQILLKHNMIQQELYNINNDTDKYRSIVSAKLRQELKNYVHNLNILENKNTAQANGNSKLINELKIDNFSYLIYKLIFNVWNNRIQHKRETMAKYRDKNKLFITANKQNSGGKGADLFGVVEAQRFANAMLKRSFDGLIKVCSRRKDCSIKFTGDKNTNNTLYLGFIIYSAICVREKQELGSIKFKTAVDLLMKYNTEGIKLDYSTTIKIRWKSLNALKWYNDPGKSRTIHALKIKNGPSEFLWKSQKKSKCMSSGNHLNSIFNFQLQIHIQKDSLIITFNDSDLELDIGHFGGDMASVKRYMTHEGYNDARNNKSMVSKDTLKKGAFGVPKSSEFGSPDCYIQTYMVVHYCGLLFCIETLKFDRAYKKRLQIGYTFGVSLQKGHAAHVYSVEELSMTTPINGTLDQTLFVYSNSYLSSGGVHFDLQAEMLRHYGRVRKYNRMLSFVDIENHTDINVEYVLNILKTCMHDHRIMYRYLDNEIDDNDDLNIRVECKFDSLCLKLGAQIERLVKLIDIYELKELENSTLHTFKSELISFNSDIERFYRNDLKLHKCVRHKSNLRKGCDGGAGGSIKQKSVLVFTAEFVRSSHIQTYMINHCAAKRSFTMIAEQSISGLKVSSSFDAPDGNNKHCAFNDINHKTDLRFCDIKEMKNETEKESMRNLTFDKIRRFNRMVDGKECMGSYLCGEEYPLKDMSVVLTPFVPNWQYVATQGAIKRKSHPHWAYFNDNIEWIEAHSLTIAGVCLAVDAKLCTYGEEKGTLIECEDLEHENHFYGYGTNFGIPNTPKPLGWYTKLENGSYEQCSKDEIVRNDHCTNKYFFYSKPTGKPITAEDIEDWNKHAPYNIFYNHVQDNILQYYNGSIDEFNKYELTSTYMGEWPQLNFDGWVTEHLKEFHVTYGPWMEDYERLLCHLMRYVSTLKTIQNIQRKPYYDLFKPYLSTILKIRFDIVNEIANEKINDIHLKCKELDDINLEQCIYLLNCYLNDIKSVAKQRELKLLKQKALNNQTLWICKECNKLVESNMVQCCCYICYQLYHGGCTHLNNTQINKLKSNKYVFLCDVHSVDGKYCVMERKKCIY